MRLFDRFRLMLLTRKHSSKWSEKDKRKIIELIDARNKKIEVVREQIFEGEGQVYCFYYDNGNIHYEGHYYSLGYDKRGILQDEKFQGRNVEYYENGKIKEVTFYKDGAPTGEYYSYDIQGNLKFSQPAGS